jgi:HlyD family secretion protein
MKLKWYWVLAAVVVAGLAAGGAYMFWKEQESRALPAGIVGINGRVEATQAQIATKIAGRVIEIVPREGDIVAADSIFARLDKSELEAQLHQGQAEAARYRRSLARAQADTLARKAELKLSEENLKRTSALLEKGYATQERYDQRKQSRDSAAAALTAATEAVEEGQAAVKAADANVKRLQSLLDDTTIKSPLRGRVQYRLIEPGEVLPAGGRIATVVDLTYVYMTLFLPASQAGRLTINDDARIIVDAVPQYVFPATVSFVSPESQFTPKSVETQSEREQLYFRVKLQAPLSLLKGIEERVKTGLRGMGYVKLDPEAAWPAWLTPKLPPATPQASR